MKLALVNENDTVPSSRLVAPPGVVTNLDSTFDFPAAAATVRLCS